MRMRRRFHEANIVVVPCIVVVPRFAGHRTIEMLGLFPPKVSPVSNYTQQVPTSANIVVVPCKRTQQVTTLLGPTLLHVVSQQCCVCLHGPVSLISFKLYATSANIVVVPCKWMQHVGPNNVACC